MNTPADVSWKLKALREAAGLSLRQMADELGVPTSSYRHYEERLKRAYLPAEKAQQIGAVLAKRGILPEYVMALAGPSGHGQMAEPVGSFDRRPPAHRPAATAPAPQTDIQIRVHGRFAQVSATIDKAGLARLRQQLDAVETLLED